MSISATLLLFAMPNHLKQLDRATVGFIQNDTLRVENILREKKALHPQTIEAWPEEDAQRLRNYMEEGQLYDKNGRVLHVPPVKTQYVPKQVVQEELFSDLNGCYFLNTLGDVYYVGDPDAPVPQAPLSGQVE